MTMTTHPTTGITPACAGNTRPLPLRRSPSRDHPRLRGEYTRKDQYLPAYTGSPPLARGIRYLHQRARQEPGITPACAGNTYLSDLPVLASGDHPRLRGEYLKKQIRRHTAMGSPPLARGIRSKQRLRLPTSGITPACAGNTDTLVL